MGRGGLENDERVVVILVLILASLLIILVLVVILISQVECLHPIIIIRDQLAAEYLVGDISDHMRRIVATARILRYRRAVLPFQSTQFTDIDS